MKHPNHTTPTQDVPTLAEMGRWPVRLWQLHERLRPYFARPEPLHHALLYLQAIISDIPRKNGWQIAEHARQLRPYDEVDGRRGTVHSSDLPEISSGGFVKTALFQPSLPEPDRRLSTHPALQGDDSTGIGLLRHPPHPLGFVHLPLRSFTLSRALPQAFDYYDRSVTMSLSACR